jgi:D-alanyl-D-alanine carboxypeptidase
MVRGFALLPLGATGQPIPQTPAGKIFSEWLSAYNSEDRGKIESFRTAHGFRPSADETVWAHQYTGDYNVLRIEKSEPLSVSVILEAAEAASVWRRTFTVSADNPGQISGTTMDVVSPSADLPIARMTQEASLAALSARADKAHAEDKLSGAMLIARGANVIFEKTWGLANRETNTPVTLDTKFRLGSAPKMFTAVAVLQLVQQQRLSLDGTVGHYLPEYPNREIASKVTVRELLNHTGGTGDIFGPDFTSNRPNLKSNSDYVTLYGARPPQFEPGTKDAYSNYGFVLLGALVEQVSGKSYYDYLRENIFLSARMTNTDAVPETDPVPDRSMGYMWRDGHWVSNADTLPYRGMGAGGAYSTVGDLFKFAQALQAGKLLPSELLAEATRPQNHGGWYGYGFGVDGAGPFKNYGHDGGAPGMNASFRVYPNLNTVIVALSNLDPPAAKGLANYYALRMPTN